MDLNVMQNQHEEYVWFNGKFLKSDMLNLSIMTHSLHYAGAVFEGERAYNGKIFQLEAHTQRLLASAKAMSLEIPYSAGDIITASNELLRMNNLDNAYVRPIIWRESNSLAIDSETNINIAILAKKSLPKIIDDYKLLLSHWRKIPQESMPTQCKGSANYAMMRIAKEDATNKGFDDALILDIYGEVAESSTANIFFAKGNKLFTPIADRFLNGITRQTIFKIAQRLDLEIIEKRISLAELSAFDDCFLTGTAAAVRGVGLIKTNDKTLNFPSKKMTELMRKEYFNLTMNENDV